MTTYKAIHGKLVQHLTSDPDNAAFEGQIWFNTSSSDYKTIIRPAGTWASGGNVNTNRTECSAGAGIQTAGIIFGGGPDTALAVAETYDGASWTEVGDLSTGRRYPQSGQLGTQTSTIAFGGSPGGS